MLRQLRVIALWVLGLVAAFFLVSLAQGLGTDDQSQAVVPVGNDSGVAPALPVAAVPAATRAQGVARPSPTPPLTYDEARQRLRSFAAMLKHDNLVSGSTPDRERTVLLLESIESLSVELDGMRAAFADRPSTSESFARVRRDITIMAGVVGSFPPLYEASHDRYTALVGHLQILYGAMTALKGVAQFEQQLRQSTPQSGA